MSMTRNLLIKYPPLEVWEGLLKFGHALFEPEGRMRKYFLLHVITD